MRHFLERQWPLIGFGILLALVAFYLAKSSREVVKGPMLKEIMSGEGVKLKDIHYTQDDSDKGLKWVMDAKEVRFSGDKKSIVFHDFRLMVKGENRPFLRLKGKRGNYSSDSGQINLWGDLEGFSTNGYRIITQHILINEKSGCLSTDEPVKIYGAFFSVAGRGILIELENEKLGLLSDVTAIVDKGSLIK